MYISRDIIAHNSTIFELIIDLWTTYSSLLESFPELYSGLTTIPVSLYLTRNQAATFVSDEK